MGASSEFNHRKEYISRCSKYPLLLNEKNNKIQNQNHLTRSLAGLKCL